MCCFCQEADSFFNRLSHHDLDSIVMNRPQVFLRLISILVLTIAATLPAVHAFDGPEASPEKEQELLTILRSDAPSADKAIASKNLAIYGSSASVADLAKLLPDAQLSSWARIALESIPGDAADESLRTATDTLEGKLLVGTINSIGVRRDPNAVNALAPRLQHADAEVVAAAAVALGRIGNAAAADSLRKSLATAPADVRTSIAEGCVLCAERFLSEGKSAGVVSIYD